MKKLIFLLLFTPTLSFGMCFKEAGDRYKIEPDLLRAIAQTESSMRPMIESPTQDIGLMGINRSWLPILRKRFGISEADVWNPCMNVMIGAWILASNFAQHGKNWNAIGAYNAVCSKLKGAACYERRQKYSLKVWQTWRSYQNKS
jgi:soluble lytic murein transglycosylase-like protein